MIGKTSKNMTYNFSSKHFPNFLGALLTLNTLVMRLDIVEAFLFTLFNQKFTYDY